MLDVQDIVDKLVAAGVIGWVALVTKHVIIHPIKDKKSKDVIFTKIREIEHGRRRHLEAPVGVQDPVAGSYHSHCPTCGTATPRMD